MTTVEQGREFRAPAEFLHMRNMDIARGQKVVLQEVNLRIASGEHIAIMGPNGYESDPDQGHDLRVLSHGSCTTWK